MNPFNFFKTYASTKGVEEFEKRLTDFLIHNRLFQYFAHRSDTAVKEAGEKILREAAKVVEKPRNSSKSTPGNFKLKP